MQCRGQRFDFWSRRIPRAAGQLSPCTTTTEPVLWSPRATITEAHRPQSLCSTIREATAVKSPRTAAREQSPLMATREAHKQQPRPSVAKSINQYFKKLFLKKEIVFNFSWGIFVKIIVSRIMKASFGVFFPSLHLSACVFAPASLCLISEDL